MSRSSLDLFGYSQSNEVKRYLFSLSSEGRLSKPLLFELPMALKVKWILRRISNPFLLTKETPLTPLDMIASSRFSKIEPI